MMRKNEPPADPALCHICLSLKNRLFHGAGAGGHHVHTKHQEMWEMTDLSLRAPAEGQRGCTAASSVLARLAPLRLLQAPPCPAQWDWWRSGPKQPISASQEISPCADRWVELFRCSRSECAAPDGTSQPGSSEEMVWDLGQFLLSNREPGRCFVRPRIWDLPPRCSGFVHTQNENM